MSDPSPGHVGNMEKPVHAAEIDKGAVVGDVLDHPVDDVALVEPVDDFGALLRPALLEYGAAGHDNVVAAPVHLQDLERLLDVHEGACVPDGTDIDLRAGKECNGPAKIDRVSPLDLVEDRAFHSRLAGIGLLQPVPGLLASRLVP